MSSISSRTPSSLDCRRSSSSLALAHGEGDAFESHQVADLARLTAWIWEYCHLYPLNARMIRYEG